jgi:hypothetical protein
VTFGLDLRTPAPREDVVRLVRHAERACHAAQTFRAPVPTDLRVTCNGSALDVGGS